MSYVDQQMSSRRVVAIVIVALLHAAIGYAFISGLAMSVAKQVLTDTKVFDVVEPPPPPEEPPPPPPEQPQQVQPPPLVTPPPVVQTPVPPPVQMQSVPIAPPNPPVTPLPPVTLAPPTPAPPAVPAISKAAAARGNPASWVTQDDYPPSSLRNEEEGSVGVTFDIGTDGRIQNCRVTSSSSHPALDDATCKLVTRRGRYSPALNQAGQPVVTAAKSLRFKWQIEQ
jgi:periplasmic protein TonB